MTRFALAALCLCAVAAVPQQGKFVQPRGRFECAVPSGWKAEIDDSSSALGVYSAKLVSPDSSEKAPAIVFLSYYAKGNKVHKDAGEFIGKHTANPLKLKTKKTGAVARAKVNGLSAEVFERSKTIFLPPEDPAAKQVRIKESYAVVKSTEGFFVLHFYAAADKFDKQTRAFDGIKKSFTVK